MSETEIPSEAQIRSEIYFYLGSADLELADVTPEMEYVMMKLYERAYVQGFNTGIDYSLQKIIEGISDGVEFVAEKLKIEQG